MMIHATGKVAGSIVEGLKGQPLALTLVIVNVLCLMIVGYTLYQVAERAEARDLLITKLATECGILKPKG